MEQLRKWVYWNEYLCMYIYFFLYTEKRLTRGESGRGVTAPGLDLEITNTLNRMGAGLNRNLGKGRPLQKHRGWLLYPVVGRTQSVGWDAPGRNVSVPSLMEGGRDLSRSATRKSAVPVVGRMQSVLRRNQPRHLVVRDGCGPSWNVTKEKHYWSQLSV